MIFDRNHYINQPVPIEKELKILFNQKDALTLFEIGACEGEDSIKYSRLFPNSKIYVFEPLPNNIKLIKNNLLQYNISNVYYFNKALSSKEGVAEFFVSESKPNVPAHADWDFGNKSSSLLPPDKHIEYYDFIKFEKKIKVETSTIRHFCEKHIIAEIDFVHMDVQGAELMVLKGAENFISSIKSVWLEVSTIKMYKQQPLVNKIKSFMKDNNFILIKDCVERQQGDQLYVSKIFFPHYKALFPDLPVSKEKFLLKLIKKINSFCD